LIHFYKSVRLRRGERRGCGSGKLGVRRRARIKEE